MLSSEALLTVLEKAQRKMFDQNGEPVVKGWNKRILYYFTDVNEYWLVKVVVGKPEPPAQQPGNLDEVDVRLTMSTDTFAGVVNGEIPGLQAFTTGKVRVKASLSDLSKLQTFI